MLKEQIINDKNTIELEDYMLVWKHDKIKLNCCGKEYLAVYHKDSDELECKDCNIMSKFIVK